MPRTRAQTGRATGQPSKKDAEQEKRAGTGNGKKRGPSPAKKAPSKRTKVQKTNDEGPEVKYEKKYEEPEVKDEKKDEALEVKDEKKDETAKASSMKQEGTTPAPEDEKHVTFEGKIRERSVSPKEEYKKDHGILERGHIYFFYRPKVAVDEPQDVDDVAKLTILLVPRPPRSEAEKKQGKDLEEDSKHLTGREAASSDPSSAAPSPAPQSKPEQFFRYMVVGKKHLPSTESGSREVLWGTVADVGHDLSSLDQGLERQVYQTKTRGERTKGAARPAGRGLYVICSPTNPKLPPSRRHRTFLVYALTHPDPPGEPQRELGIEASSSFLLQVKNPTTASAPGVGLKPERRAKYPEEAKEEAFGGGATATKFGPANPTTLMDYEGAELLLIGDKKDLDDIVEDGSSQEMQTAASEEVKLSTEDVLRELVMDAKKFPPDALEGDWV